MKTLWMRRCIRLEMSSPVEDQTMANDLHYFMFFVGRLFQGAEMMIKHSEYIEADESNLMYDFVAAREATREALKDVREFLETISSPEGPKTNFD
jgi:hypothetical protein